MTDDALEHRRMLIETAASFARKELAPAHLRTAHDDAPFSRERWAAMADLGLLGLLIPEEHGGLELSTGDMVAVIEELGRPLLREPLVAVAGLAAVAIVRGDNATLKSRLLPAIASGETVAALAWQESYAAPQRSSFRTTATRDGDETVLTGAKMLVMPGAGADGYVVAAEGETGTGLYWVPAGSRGLGVTLSEGADRSPVAALRLEGVRVPGEDCVAATGQEALDFALDSGAICASAELMGLMRGANEMTFEYLKTRSQFGKRIGSFQTLQHRAVDMYTKQEMSAAVLAEAVRLFELAKTPTERSIAASRAKARLSAEAMFVAKQSIQLHGGIGYTDEHDIGLYLKRALVLSAWLGNATEHQDRYADLTLGAAA